MRYSTKSELIQFEELISQHWEEGELPYLIHLSGGNEDFLIDFFDQNVNEGDWIFSSHRSHYHALLSGVSPFRLEKLILDGNSMFVFDNDRNFLTSSILAGTCCIAVGVAWALKNENSINKVWCFLGDGAEEEGHFYEAVMMTQGHNLPCKFIIEDNNRSVDSTRRERMPTDFRMNWPDCVVRNSYISSFPHAGNGTKKIIKFKKSAVK
jgi:TPP-dependent pyruvate/acetoin dehydrogenase alpha subunit